MTEREIMVKVTPFQINRCVQLDQSLKKIRLYGQLLKESGGQPIPVTVGRQNTLEIDDQLIDGMNKCAFSFYIDLKDQGLKEVANDILNKNRPQTTTFK